MFAFSSAKLEKFSQKFSQNFHLTMNTILTLDGDGGMPGVLLSPEPSTLSSVKTMNIPKHDEVITVAEAQLRELLHYSTAADRHLRKCTDFCGALSY